MDTPLPRREFFRTAATLGAASLAAPLAVQRLLGGTAVVARPFPDDRMPDAGLRLSGWIQGYLEGVTANWLKVAPSSNPGILEMFRDRDRQPLRDMVPWAGEFAGKYLTSAVKVYRLTGDAELRKLIANFASELTSLQGEDGYLGPWPAGSHLTGKAPNCDKGRGTWDAWGHYHVMFGLMQWHETSGDAAALGAARRIADLICATFAGSRLVDTGNTEMNLAPIHSLALLYRKTGEERYLRMAEKIRGELAATDAAGRPLAGDFVNGPLSGKEFFELPKPRWEGLHTIQGLAELASITGDDRSRQAVENVWWSIVKLDRHNNGGFSSGEKACGDPYDPKPIETCCTIAWTALGIDMLRLTDNPVVADELELSALNSIVGLHSPNGRWVTYNTPMDGVRKSSGQDIVFQAREGTPELNCCSVNGARGLGMIGDWAVMKSPAGVNLNWYGPCSMSLPAGGGGKVAIEQETDYPRGNAVRLKVGTAAPSKLALRLRIPHWSAATQVRLNGRAVSGVKAGSYLSLDRTWQTGDTIDVEFDFSLQFWAGERECEGRASIYRGPILLTYDRRFNSMDPADVPALAAHGLGGRLVSFAEWLPPMMLVEFRAADGRAVRLCDFGSAGVGGSPYRTWLDVTGCAQTEFSRTNPRRTSPVA